MPTPTPMIESLATARFKTVKAAEPIEVSVHFNPASLQYTVSNTLKDQGSGSKKKQYVSQTTAKLTMDLVFDTTATGVDVRETTDKMAKLLKPHGPSGKQVPPVVEFGWGVYRFTGMVEQYKETLDFFAASGVPLRSSVNLTLSSQDVIFESNKNPNASVDGNLIPEPVSVPTSPGPAGGPAGLANSLGDPRAARAIAAANGSASLRFSAGAELAVGVGAGVSLSAAAAFSTGASAGFGLGISGGAGLGISGGVGAGVSADFSGLRASASTEVSMPDPGTALTLTADAGAGGGTQFGLGGRAQSTGSASLSADVGANAELTARLGFGGA
ncbi:MAG TPA: hypothetical protein VFT24_06155 [Vicinamibacterales bacterium]|nr:hypothetical protein [Vicinamibacterales bacterium]